MPASAVSAHLHLGVSGKTGNVAIKLCDSCKSETQGAANLSAATAAAVGAGGSYVELHSRTASGTGMRGRLARVNTPSGDALTLKVVSPKDGDIIVPPAPVRFEVTGLVLGAEKVRIEASIGEGTDKVSVLLDSTGEPGLANFDEPGLTNFPADKRFSGRHDVTFVIVRADGTVLENPEARVTVHGLIIQAGR